MKVLNKIRLWWKFDGKHYHTDFIQGVKNLWKWFPTIWKDRDWDDSYIYEVLRVKLEKQAHYIARRDFHVDAQRDAERMLLCARLIRIQQEDLYGMEYLDYIKENFEFAKREDGYYEVETTLISDNLEEYLAKYPRQCKRVLTGMVNRYKIHQDELVNTKLMAMEVAHENQQRSRKLLFKIMEEHIEGWWD